MRSYVGIDAHCNSGLEFAAIDGDGGELLWRDRRPLSGDQLVEVISEAPRPRMAVFEQGELAPWLYLGLEPHCDEVVSANPRHNRLIAQSPDKDDPFDALTLAQLARGGYIREVYQPPEEFLELRHRVRHQDRLRRTSTRLKNQIKSLFRQNGVPVNGSQVYSAAHRTEWLGRLPCFAQPEAQDLLEMLDQASDWKRQAERSLARAVRRFAPARRLLSVPEIGPVRAATFVAYVVTPERFPSNKHVWSYCGFGLQKRRSGSSAEPTRLRKNYNRHLKRVISGAVEQLICRDPSEPFAAGFHTRITRGTSLAGAKLTIGRKLINTLCALWQREELYDPDKVIAG